MRRTLITLVVLAGALGAAWGVVTVTAAGQTTPILSYAVVDEDTISVEVTTGNLTWTRVVAVSETAASVTVTVTSFRIPLLAGTAVGHPLFLPVDLSDPLGGRDVRDGNRTVEVR